MALIDEQDEDIERPRAQRHRLAVAQQTPLNDIDFEGVKTMGVRHASECSGRAPLNSLRCVIRR